MRIRAVVLAVALAAAAPDAGAGGLLQVVPPGDVPETAPPPCAHCAVLQGQLRQGCAPPPDAPYADVIYLRRALEPDLPDDLRRAIAEVRAIGDPGHAARRLGPYLLAGEPGARYAAGLFLGLTLYQSGAPLNSPDGRAALRAMTRAAPRLDMPASDLAFLEALAALEEGRTTAAIAAAERAVRAEPRFFAAIALALRLHIDRAGRVEGSGRALCRAAYDRILSLTAAYFDLGPCPQQAAHMETFLARGQTAPERTPALQAVKVYLAMIARRPDLARRAAARYAALDGPACRAEIAAQLRALVPDQPE